MALLDAVVDFTSDTLQWLDDQPFQRRVRLYALFGVTVLIAGFVWVLRVTS